MKKSILIFLFFTLIGCEKENPQGKEFDSYLSAYLEPVDLIFHYTISYGDPTLWLNFESITWLNMPKKYINHTKFHIFAEKFGDIGYKKPDRSNPSALSEIIQQITVTSDQDFIPGYPAGTPLNDLLTVNTKTIYPYIASGYKGSSIPTEINKPLNMLEVDDLILVVGNIKLIFSELPDDLDQEHEITVTVVTDEQTFTKTRTIDFRYDSVDDQ